MNPASAATALIRQRAAASGAIVAIDDERAAHGAIRIRTSIAVDGVALLERSSHATEGGPVTRRARLDMTDAIAAEALLAAAIERIALLQRRERELHGAEPAWSFSIGSVATSILRYVGLDPADLAAPGPAADWGRSVSGGTRPDIDVRLVGSRMLFKSLRAPGATPRDVLLQLDETNGTTSLTINRWLPDTIAAAARDRTLGEVVNHPALPQGVVVLNARAGALGAPEIRLSLADDDLHVAPPYASNADWLELGPRPATPSLFT